MLGPELLQGYRQAPARCRSPRGRGPPAAAGPSLRRWGAAGGRGRCAASAPAASKSRWPARPTAPPPGPATASAAGSPEAPAACTQEDWMSTHRAVAYCTDDIHTATCFLHGCLQGRISRATRLLPCMATLLVTTLCTADPAHLARCCATSWSITRPSCRCLVRSMSGTTASSTSARRAASWGHNAQHAHDLCASHM